jgi:hypothetical protein
MKPFEELGAIIEARWRAANYADDSFAELAANALLESDLTTTVDPWEIIRWVHSTPVLPEQHDPKANFGNPPITVFNGRQFHIDVYYWLDGTTSIHQHSFSGAFQVLLGSSVHSRYAFENAQMINDHFILGDLRAQSVELLSEGTIKQIHSGPQFIHSLFHLERPSVTITIRTQCSAHDRIQYAYMAPHIAYDPFFEGHAFQRKIQTVSLMLDIKHPEADRFVEDLLDTADFHTTFFVLDRAFSFLAHNELEELFHLSKSSDRFEKLLHRAKRKHGDLIELVPPVLEEKHRQSDILRRRALIRDPSHRFFLAILLNVPERDSALRMLKERFTDRDPIELVIQWIRELTAMKIFGSREPNVLNLNGFDEKVLAVFGGMLRGFSTEQIRSHLSLPTDFAVKETAKRIRGNPLFKTFFVGQGERHTREQGV